MHKSPGTYSVNFVRKESLPSVSARGYTYTEVNEEQKVITSHNEMR